MADRRPEDMGNRSVKKPLAFIALALVCYAPFAIFSGVQVFPNWSLINFAAFLPAALALVITMKERGARAAGALLKRSLDFQRIKTKRWFVTGLVMMPLVVFLQIIYAWVRGLPIVSPKFSIWWPVLFIAMFIAAIGEELGLMLFIFDPLQERIGALYATLVLGIFQALYHIPLFTPTGLPTSWIVWQLVYIASTRILYSWVYQNTGKSLFSVVVMHTLFNSIWFLFPRNADWSGIIRPAFYDPATLAVITILLGALVTFLWGPSTLARFRYRRHEA